MQTKNLEKWVPAAVKKMASVIPGEEAAKLRLLTRPAILKFESYHAALSSL